MVSVWCVSPSPSPLSGRGEFFAAVLDGGPSSDIPRAVWTMVRHSS